MCRPEPRKRGPKKDAESALRQKSAWKRKSEEIRRKAGFVCEYCATRGRWEVGLLEVHHITKLKDEPGALLENENLICLCVTCHKQADAGEIPAETLREIARRRESGAATLYPPG